jgi:uncharacterized iron-regulated membrane protein
LDVAHYSDSSAAIESGAARLDGAADVAHDDQSGSSSRARPVRARVVGPSSDHASFLVMFSTVRPTPLGRADLTSVDLDQYTGARLTQPLSAGPTADDAIMSWVGPLHVDSFGGIGVKLVWLVLGLAPARLFVPGFIMWWLRVVGPRWMRVSQPAVEIARI